MLLVRPFLGLGCLGLRVQGFRDLRLQDHDFLNPKSESVLKPA